MNNILQKLVYRSDLIGKLLGYFNTKFQFSLLSFYNDKKIVELIKTIKNEVDFAFFPFEAFLIYSIAKSQSSLEGEMAEVGVYQGGSAKLICEAKGNKKLNLFDTFEGLPHVSEIDTHFGTKFWNDNEFNSTSEEIVKKFLSDYNNVYIYKGKFPETAEPVTKSIFSFVHLDVDLYESTLSCLKFFYPRLINGGIILTHDFHTKGVSTAFREFFQNKTIPKIELAGSQCMIIKIE